MSPIKDYSNLIFSHAIEKKSCCFCFLSLPIMHLHKPFWRRHRGFIFSYVIGSLIICFTGVSLLKHATRPCRTPFIEYCMHLLLCAHIYTSFSHFNNTRIQNTGASRGPSHVSIFVFTNNICFSLILHFYSTFFLSFRSFFFVNILQLLKTRPRPNVVAEQSPPPPPPVRPPVVSSHHLFHVVT